MGASEKVLNLKYHSLGNRTEERGAGKRIVGSNDYGEGRREQTPGARDRLYQPKNLESGRISMQ